MARAIADIRKKDAKALHKLLAEKRNEVQTLVREKRTSEQKNVRALNKLKKEIAMILTVLNEEKAEDK